MDDTSNTWFDQMTGYLTWKLHGPDITNPYKTPQPVQVLQRMANNRDFLIQFVQIRCMCDGYEVMVISNPNAPRITTNHPSLTSMNRADVVDYIRRVRLDEHFDEEIDRIQDEICTYLKLREASMSKDEKNLLKKNKPKQKVPSLLASKNGEVEASAGEQVEEAVESPVEPEQKPEAKKQQYRIIRK